jgi:hypothetical protein
VCTGAVQCNPSLPSQKTEEKKIKKISVSVPVPITGGFILSPLNSQKIKIQKKKIETIFLRELRSG